MRSIVFLATRVVALMVVLIMPAAMAAPAEQPVGGATEAPPQVNPAVDGVLDLFKQKSVVALGDAHGMAQELDFYSALVRDPRFAEQVGNVIVEFGGEAGQDSIDRYVAGEDVPFTQLRRVWTDVVGWFPGETQLVGIVNFFASVRAANRQLPPARQIKVWLGDPKIDWSQVHSFQDVQPLLRQRDENLFRIVNEAILRQHKKAVLIVGLGHLFGPGGAGPLSEKIAQSDPNALAVVAPFLGYLEADCNAKFLTQTQSWPTPALAGPVSGTSLKSWLQLSGCNYVPPEQVERMKKMAAAGPPPGARLPGSGGSMPGTPPSGGRRLGPGKPMSPMDMLAAQIDVLSGVKADAILYLGSPQSLTQSPIEPSAYLDLDYFKELSRRSQCCTPGARALDWNQMVEEGAAAPRKYTAQ